MITCIFIPNIELFKTRLRKCINLEKQIAIKNDKLQQFKSRLFGATYKALRSMKAVSESTIYNLFSFFLPLQLYSRYFPVVSFLKTIAGTFG